MTRQVKNPLTVEEKILIGLCKEERQRIDEEIRAMTKADRIGFSAMIERAKRERRELSDARLAEKFETSKYQIFLA